VRAIIAVRTGVYLAGSCLAGFGVAALLRRRGPMTRALLTTGIFALACGEIFFHPRSGPGFGVRYAPFAVAPPASLRTLLAQLPDGPILDYPPSEFIPINAHYLSLAGFHGRPTDACYNSFRTPLQDEVRRLAASLLAPVAALRLRTLGFRGIVGHLEYMEPVREAALRTWAAGDGKQTLGLRQVGETADHVVYAIDDAPPTEGLAALATPPGGLGARRKITVKAGAPLEVTVRNGTRAFYRHPDPIRLSLATLTWRDHDDAVVTTEQLKVLLPLALVPGQTTPLTLAPKVFPPPGTYDVTLRLGTDGAVLAKEAIAVSAPPGIDAPQ
jgi:catechol 2,3-dioxygenase-like lactoylglutathione lyase family enzyme